MKGRIMVSQRSVARRSSQASLASDLDATLRMKRDNQRDAGFTADFMERVAAFGERRPARFVGR